MAPDKNKAAIKLKLKKKKILTWYWQLFLPRNSWDRGAHLGKCSGAGVSCLQPTTRALRLEFPGVLVVSNFYNENVH